jgi:N,N'-diacetylchitobiose phosphorylase
MTSPNLSPPRTQSGPPSEPVTTFGRFDNDAREYVVTRPDTPRSWTNYLGDTEYGAILSNNAGGYSFFRTASEGRFTRLRFNNVPMDQPGRYFYLRDEKSGDFWSSSWQPVGKSLEAYQSTCRHGTGYTRIDSEYDGVTSETTYFVPREKRFEIWHLTVTNHRPAPARLALFSYVEFTNHWNIDQDQFNLQYSQYIGRATFQDNFVEMASNGNLPHDWSSIKRDGNAMLSWMTLVGGEINGYDLSRETFIGPYGTYAAPEVVKSGRTTQSESYGDNSCGALRTELELQPGESKTFMVLLGVGEAAVEGAAALAEFNHPDQAVPALAAVKEYWHGKLGSLTVQTPDPDFDTMVNVWNAYSCLMTFNWSRSASFVYNGHRNGLGFRDSVQDVVGVLPMIPEAAGRRLDLMLSGQFSNGGALPVVPKFGHEPGNTPMIPEAEFRSDDCLWFFNAIPAYVAETGDLGFYHKVIPYADAGEDTVLGHLRRALEFNLARTGQHGLPCGLAADWNDCLKLGYHGESLFVAFQVRLGLAEYANIARLLELPRQAEWADTRREALEENIQSTCWSKDRFIWAIAEDGTVYGTHDAPEGAIYLNTQVWSVISGSATPEQARTCMDTLKDELATDYGVKLCAPAVASMPVEIMAARLFNPGTKENAGIFNHPQGWVVMAECLLGRGDRAYAYHAAYMPAKFNDQAHIRQMEPYVYGQSTHADYSPYHGASRVPWLSGTAAWAYYSATAHILGLRPENDGFTIDPCIPSDWPGFTATRQFRGRTLNIEVTNPHGVQKGVKAITVEGKPVEGTKIPLDSLSDDCRIHVTMGEKS